MAIPRTLWMLWLQGWDKAPEIVRACAQTWRHHNPGWDIKFLSREDLSDLFPPASPNHMRVNDPGIPPEFLADLVRMELLTQYGGVWADATTYCLRPLDEWIDAAAASGFFAFDKPGPGRMLSNWFLVSPADGYVIRKWRSLAEAYWLGREAAHIYFWHHTLFGLAYNEDADIRHVWDMTQKISAAHPHVMAPYQATLFLPVEQAAHKTALMKDLPLMKLTHKITYPEDDAGTLYRWLCDSAFDLDKAVGSGAGALAFSA